MKRRDQLKLGDFYVPANILNVPARKGGRN